MFMYILYIYIAMFVYQRLNFPPKEVTDTMRSPGRWRYRRRGRMGTPSAQGRGAGMNTNHKGKTMGKPIGKP